MKEKRKLIINPNSAGGRGRRIANYVAEKYQHLFSEVVFTSAPEEAIELAKNSELFDTVCFIGGDGTLNEVVNGIMQIPDGRRPKIGIIPVGTGNDFIKTLGIPKNVDSAIDIICNGRVKRVDVATCTFRKFGGEKVSRFYVNITEFGMGGEVANLVNKYGKVFRGTIPFLIFAIVCNFKYKNKKIKMVTNSVDDRFKLIEPEIRVVAVANGRFYGGGMEIAPFAQPDDGMLDITVVELGPFETLSKIRLLYKGKKGLEEAKKTGKISYFNATEVQVEGADGLMIEMEGETPGHSPEKFQLIPKQLDFIIP